ncbi:MAG: hypothetical protein IPH57_08375 [Saprospiraceae bacterium]|nr:hypothetical protein [Saprospiraceae bacterium]
MIDTGLFFIIIVITIALFMFFAGEGFYWKWKMAKQNNERDTIGRCVEAPL